MSFFCQCKEEVKKTSHAVSSHLQNKHDFSHKRATEDSTKILQKEKQLTRQDLRENL